MTPTSFLVPCARVVAGDAGWYVENPWSYGNYCTYYGPILSVEMAYEVAEEVEAYEGRAIREAMRAVREHWKEIGLS
jgi:hypothetical protein